MPGLAPGQGDWQSNAELPWERRGHLSQAETESENEPAFRKLKVTDAVMPKQRSDGCSCAAEVKLPGWCHR